MFDASDSAGDSVDRSRRQPMMRRYILYTRYAGVADEGGPPPTAIERQLSDIFISSNLQALPRHRHDDGAARGDYSTAVFCILPARLSCSACSVLKTVPHPLLAPLTGIHCLLLVCFIRAYSVYTRFRYISACFCTHE